MATHRDTDMSSQSAVAPQSEPDMSSEYFDKLSSEEKSLFLASFSEMFDVKLTSLENTDYQLPDDEQEDYFSRVQDYLKRRVSDEDSLYLMPFADVDGDKITLPGNFVIMPGRRRSKTMPSLLSVDDDYYMGMRKAHSGDVHIKHTTENDPMTSVGKMTSSEIGTSFSGDDCLDLKKKEMEEKK